MNNSPIDPIKLNEFETHLKEREVLEEALKIKDQNSFLESFLKQASKNQQ
jgi:hypothetical protein